MPGSKSCGRVFRSGRCRLAPSAAVMRNAAARARAASGTVTRRSTPKAAATAATAANASGMAVAGEMSRRRRRSAGRRRLRRAAASRARPASGRCAGSAGSWPWSASQAAARSRHVRANGPRWSRLATNGIGAGAGEPAVGGLQAEDAAQAGRHADRAVGVAAERERHQPARDRGAAAARGAAGRAGEIVRVVARAVMRVLGGEAVGVLVHVEGADADRAGRAHPRAPGRRRRRPAASSRSIFEPATVTTPARSNRFLTA